MHHGLCQNNTMTQCCIRTQYIPHEILQQCPDVTDVVVSTGTGATAAGLRKFLPTHITIHSRPAKSGTIEGLTDEI